MLSLEHLEAGIAALSAFQDRSRDFNHSSKVHTPSPAEGKCLSYIRLHRLLFRLKY